jgi:hypothetical protein
MSLKPTIFESPDGPGPLGSTGSLHIEKEQTQHGIIKTQDKAQHGGSGFGTTGGIHIEKEKTQHGIVKSEESAQHQGTGFAASASIHVEKEKTQHGIVKSDESAQHQGTGFAASASIHIEKEKTQHGIVKSEDKAQHGGTGFGTTGAIQVEKEKTSHGIVRSEEKAQHQGAGFATMGSLQTEKELVTHGIIAPGTKIKEGPADASSDSVQEHIQKRLETKYDVGREQKARQWLETLLGETFPEESFQDALKSGVRLCNALNKVYPQSVPKVATTGPVFVQRENIGNYVKACGRLGFNKSNLFETTDLYDGKNLTKVVENVYELAHFGSRKPGLPKIED